MRINRGLHWKDLYYGDCHFYEEAYRRAAETYPEYDDPEDAPAAIECFFGSRHSAVTLRSIDSEAVNLFGWGYCTLLALAMHDITGFTLTLFTKTYDGRIWSGHACIQLPNGLFLDIEGVRTMQQIQKVYAIQDTPDMVSREKFCATVAHGEHVENPMSFVGELEQLITKDFAHHVLNTYL